MSATANIHMRVDRKVKIDAEKLFHSMGLTLSRGLTLYLYKVIHTKRIPFDLTIPDKKSLKVLAKAKTGRGLHEVANADQLFKELHK